MEFKSARERLDEALQDGTGRDEMIATLTKIVADVAVRIFDSIVYGLKALEKVQGRKENKVARAWTNRAVEGIRGIEKAGSRAPGLSHQDIFVEELKGTLKNTVTLDEFLSKVEAVQSKWGSRINYPLYAGGRKKQLEELKQKVRSSLPAEEQRLRQNVEKTLAKEIERVQSETTERIDLGVTEFKGILIDALGWPKDEESVVQLRWYLIGAMTGYIFNAMNKRLGNDQADIRDLLYFAVERLMRTVYESFQHVVKKSARNNGNGGFGSSAGSNLRTLISEEIKMATKAVAEYETKLNTQKLTGEIVAAIRKVLKSGFGSENADPELFAEICAGLRGDSSMEDFVVHLKRVKGLEDQPREEILAAMKTSMEPFRSLYYVKINYVRYLKGLRNFQKSLK